MADKQSIINRVRNELGDFGRNFKQAYVGDGTTARYDLPMTLISQTGLRIFTINSGTGVVRDLVFGTDYTMEFREGILVLTTALPNGITLIAEGTSFGLFSDEDLGHFVHDAFLQHSHGANQTTRYRDASGHIRYVSEPITLQNLPEVEEILVSLLATVEALWTLTTDASTDTDVSTAEGTFVPRSQRYRQMLNQIEVLTEKYHTLSQQLNVGLFRIEIADLRRVSRTTGRLVPLYVAREYDDVGYDRHTHRAIRKLPPIDRQYAETPSSSYRSDTATADLSVYAGDTYWVDLDLPVNLTGAVVAGAIRSPYLSREPLKYFTVQILDPATGTIRLSLSPAETAALQHYSPYDVQVTDSAGVVTTYLRGHVLVDDQVTP